MKTTLLLFGLLAAAFSFGQPVKDRLAAALKQLQADAQFRHAIISLYVKDDKTNTVVFENNAQTGLAPASCQKVITSATAFELLGKDFTYKTYIGKDYPQEDKYDAGCLFIIGNGDPTLGSWRWKSTTDSTVFKKILQTLQKNGLYSFDANLVVQDYLYGLTPLPEGWIWQDIGNYYGAACFGLNWHENQYDMVLQSGKEGAAAKLLRTGPVLPGAQIINDIKIAAAGTGDNGYIYTAPYSNIIFAKGTIPSQSKPFVISGSMTDPAAIFKHELFAYLNQQQVRFKGNAITGNESLIKNIPVHNATHLLDSIVSPSLDSMNYWFLKKSINLYGEAFLKSLATAKTGVGLREGSYEKALSVLKEYWQQRGIEPSALNVIDGSGLSPANRVTTHALVTVMQYARKQSWFPSFYNALPEINGIKMKDGYINGVRSYTGYIKSKSGVAYSFSFIVNNFDGSAATVREKMWKLLDILK